MSSPAAGVSKCSSVAAVGCRPIKIDSASDVRPFASFSKYLRGRGGEGGGEGEGDG